MGTFDINHIFYPKPGLRYRFSKRPVALNGPLLHVAGPVDAGIRGATFFTPLSNNPSNLPVSLSFVAVDKPSTRVDKSSSHDDGSSSRVDGSSSRVDRSSSHDDGSSSHVDESASHVDGSSTREDRSSTRVDRSSSRVDGASTRVDESSTRDDRSSTRIDGSSTHDDGASAAMKSTLPLRRMVFYPAFHGKTIRKPINIQK